MGKIILLVGDSQRLDAELADACRTLNNPIIEDFPDSRLTPSEITKLAHRFIEKESTYIYRDDYDSCVMMITTNSDHLINGFRIQIKEGNLDCNRFEIHYYGNSSLSYEYETIYSDKRGQLYVKTDKGERDELPDGFLDEWFNTTIKLM